MLFKPGNRYCELDVIRICIIATVQLSGNYAFTKIDKALERPRFTLLCFVAWCEEHFFSIICLVRPLIHIVKSVN